VLGLWGSKELEEGRAVCLVVVRVKGLDGGGGGKRVFKSGGGVERKRVNYKEGGGNRPAFKTGQMGAGWLWVSSFKTQKTTPLKKKKKLVKCDGRRPDRGKKEGVDAPALGGRDVFVEKPKAAKEGKVVDTNSLSCLVPSEAGRGRSVQFYFAWGGRGDGVQNVLKGGRVGAHRSRT